MRFINICGSQAVQIKRGEITVDANGAFCGITELPWECVECFYFDSVESFKQNEQLDKFDFHTGITEHR